MTKKALVPFQAITFNASGLTGAVAASRYVGATATGAPTTGTFVVGDFVVTQDGHMFVCTTGGSPGTWANVGSSLTAATTVTSETTYGIAAAVGTSANYARQDHTHGTPATPAISVAGRAGAVTLTAADIGAGTFPGANSYVGVQTVTAGETLTAYNTGPASQAVILGSTAAATSANPASVPGSFQFRVNYWNGASSQTATATWSARVLNTAGQVLLYQGADQNEWGGTGRFDGALTAAAGMTIPSGQPMTTGTRTVVTGTRATTTNASDTVDLGIFSSTGGAIELRIHAHLAAPGAGTTASVTKVYEFAASATMGTLNTWYLLLPADASANAAASNDFAVEVERTALNTFQFRFRQKAIGVAGQITYTVETLADTAVTFTSSSTITAAPAAVTTVHPSNSFVAAAGNVGIGTESPGALLDVSGTARAVYFAPAGTTGASAAARYGGATASGAPASGTWVTGDWVTTQDGSVWICTSGGTPGTWAQGGGGANVQSFTSNGTWTKPAGATTVQVVLIGGGGGGGSGGHVTGSNSSGGAGGGGAGIAVYTVPASQLGATESVVVAASASGGASLASGASLPGNAGTAGNTSSFGTSVYLQATGGGAGAGGLGGTSSGGVAGSGTGGSGGSAGANGAAAIGVPTAASAGSSAAIGATGGGAGGGVSTTPTATVGSAGGASAPCWPTRAGGTAGSAGGGTGGPGVSVAAGLPVPGTGGGGGGGNTVAAAGGPGGNGGIYGGGGGGGGSSQTTGASGAGGVGAQGIVVVISW